MGLCFGDASCIVSLVEIAAVKTIETVAEAEVSWFPGRLRNTPCVFCRRLQGPLRVLLQSITSDAATVAGCGPITCGQMLPLKGDSRTIVQHLSK